jgi:hypothetical protein
MPYSAPGQGQVPDRSPRRAPYPGQREAPHHGELTAVIALLVLLVHLLLAQLTLVLTVVMYATGRISRWRPEWLAAPAGAGVLWALAIGPSRAVDGLTAGPRQVLGYLGGIGRHPGHLVHLTTAYAGSAHWLPEQLPLALILASAETLGLGWLLRRLGRGYAWRSGLIVAARRWATAASLASGGGVVTRNGCCLGLDVATGRPAAITWREAEGGVLCAGTAPTESGFGMAHAAIRRRKPVIVIDLTGSPWLAESLAAACVEPGAPFSCFGPAGPGYYEPLRGRDPARAAALVMGMIDWTDVGDQQRRSCAAYLTDALAVQAAAPGDRQVPLLDDLVRLLTPNGLRERAALIPGYHPRREVLADRASVSAGLLQADPAITAAPSAQFPRLRASALGRWLQPAPPGAPRVSLGQTIRERGVTLFSMDRGVHGDSAGMIAGLVAADLTAVCSELLEMSVSGDGLGWFNGCEVLGQRVLADLVALGQGTGTAVVLGTASAEAADRLATEVNVLVARGPVGPALAGTFVGANRSVDGSSIAGVSGSIAGAGGNRVAGATGSRFAGASGNGPVGPGANGLVGPGGNFLVGPDGNGLVGPGMNGLVGPGANGPVGTAEATGAGGLAGAGGLGGASGLAGAGGVSENGPDSALAAITAGWTGANPADSDTFALLAKHPRVRVLPRCRHVPGRVGGPPEARRRLGAGGRPGVGGRLGAAGWPGDGGPPGGGGRSGVGGRPG